jgi:hypothetical protein
MDEIVKCGMCGEPLNMKELLATLTATGLIACPSCKTVLGLPKQSDALVSDLDNVRAQFKAKLDKIEADHAQVNFHVCCGVAYPHDYKFCNKCGNRL